MGKKKKKKKGQEVKVKKHASGVEERVKSIHKIEAPDETPHHQDNEQQLERFMKFGMRRFNSKKGRTIKEKARIKHN